MSWKHALVLGCAVVPLTACGSNGPAWSDYREVRTDTVIGDVVVDTGVYRVTEADADGGCAQLTVSNVAASCLHHENATWGYMARAARVEDTRFVEVRTDPSAREFVVWSSHAPTGRSVEPIHAADNSILVWIMEPGEEPWGVQVIGPNGELGIATSFVGLPGA